MKRISIITATFNSSFSIRDCVRSINDQTYQNIEHIIIDGASHDNTLEIIKSMPNRVSKIISEPDNGIYDAMNKGLKLATGEIVGILNSDDLYVDNELLSRVVDEFDICNCDSLYGDLFYVQRDNTDIVVRTWETRQFVPGSFCKGWHPPHPTLFLRKEIYDKYGFFDIHFKLAADFEFMLRLFEKYRISSIYIPKPMIRMRMGGATSKNLRNIFNQNIECYIAFKKNNLRVSLLYPLYRLIPKLLQFIKK